MISETAATLTTSDGVTLEALVGAPPTPREGAAAAPRGGAAICHPHPLYGGDMDNPVVVRLAEVFGELGLATIRFNFRGVGQSTGAHGDGVDEQHDVEAARVHLASVVSAGSALVLAGYSFGAAVVGDVAVKHPDLAGVVLVAPPLARVDPKRFAGLAPFGDRLLVIAGSTDEICPLAAVARLRDSTPHAIVEIIEGANHFFFGKLYPLGQAATTWAQRILHL
jgi:alpha/beta superfamily hydrolase